MGKTAVMCLCLVLLAGCTATLPQKADISRSYSLQGLKSYSLKMNSDKANVDPAFNRSFAGSYSQMLEGSIKLALQKTNPALQYTPAGSDLDIDVTLEELHGGSAAARFWIGFGAGRTVSTVYVRVLKGQNVIAEGRITETTTMPNLMTGNFSNEDALMQDVALVARKVAEFVSDPVKFQEENKT